MTTNGGAPSLASGGLASPPLSRRSVASAGTLKPPNGFVCCTCVSALPPPFCSTKAGAVGRPLFVALRGIAVVAAKETNHRDLARRFRRAACPFRESATTLVVPLRWSGLGVEEQGSALIVALRRNAAVASEKTNRRGKAGRFRRTACLRDSTTTLVAALRGSGAGLEQQASTLLTFSTEKASETRPMSTRLG